MWLTREDDACVVPSDPLPAVVVSVPVDKETQPGRSANLDKCDRLLKTPEEREQCRAPARLVGLCAAGQHEFMQLVGMTDHEVAEGRVIRQPAREVLHGAEEEVGLTLRLLETL
jgi:hypothetical protein